MESWNTRKKEKIITQKVSRLAYILANGGSAILDESLAAVLPLYGEDELTIFDREKGELLACTSLNEDVISFIAALLKKGSKFSDIRIFSKEDGHFLRQGVLSMKVVPILSSGKDDVILCIENYENDSFPADDALQDIYYLLGAAVKQYMLIDRTNMAIKIDSATKLPTRDALIERLKYIIDSERSNICLGILSISNTDKLNRQDGLEAVDVLLKRIAYTLDHLLPRNVYRLGGTKFAAIFPYDVQGASACLESMVDSVLRLDKRIVTSNVVTPIRNDAYGTIFVCESHLKLCDEDVVTIVREAADIEYAKEFQHVSETYFVKDAVAVEETENADFYNTQDMVVNTASELHEECRDPSIDGTPVTESPEMPVNDNEHEMEDSVDSDSSPSEDGFFIMPDDIPESAYQQDVPDSSSVDETPGEINENENRDSQADDSVEIDRNESSLSDDGKTDVDEPDVFSMFNESFMEDFSHENLLREKEDDG